MRKLKISHSHAYVALGLLVFGLATGTVFQVFLPHALGTVVIMLRLVLIPGFIAIFMFTRTEFTLFSMIAIFFISVEFLLGSKFDKETLELLLSILACPPFFKAGIVLGSKSSARPIWRAILLSMLAFNALTIAIYVNTLLGGSIGVEAYRYVGREGQDPLFRFALGNAIELPALVAMATVAAAIALRSSSLVVALALLANLITALISQSRFVVLISAYPFFRIWMKSRLAAKVAILVIVATVIILQHPAIVGTWDSLRGRFAGNDFNSANDRWNIFMLIGSHANVSCFTFGNGLTASRHLLEDALIDNRGYRTVESVMLELFYEIGLCRMALLAFFFWYTFRNVGIRLRLRGELLLVVAQAFFLLPIISFTPLFCFAAGVLCVAGSHRKAKKVPGRRYLEPSASSYACSGSH